MKRALILTGGGVKGAFQVGALSFLSKYTPLQYEIVAGTSVGALNALAIAHFPADRHQLPRATRMLRGIWGEIKANRDIFELRFPRYFSGLWNPGMASTEPLKKLLRKHCDLEAIRNSGVKLRITAVDLRTGELVVFTETDPELLIDCVASASFPLLFDPVMKQDAIYVDGGVRDAHPLKTCIDESCNDIDLIACWNIWELPKFDKLKPNAIEIGIRSLSIVEHELLRGDIKHCLAINKRVVAGESKKQHVNLSLIYPKHDLGESFTFNPEKIVDLFKAGYNTAAVTYRASLMKRRMKR